VEGSLDRTGQSSTDKGGVNMKHHRVDKLWAIVFSLILIPSKLLFAAEEQSFDLWTLFANWFPMIVLIGVWIYFLRSPKLNKTWTQYEEANRHLEKIEQTLERIARALEKK
jgi:hypothetical protein